MNQAELRRILTDKNLAQLGDAILNFTLSAAITRTSGRPAGRRVRNSLLTPIIDGSSLKQSLPIRASRHDRANAFEALTGHLWLQGKVHADDVISVMEKASGEFMREEEREEAMLQAVFKLLVNTLEKTETKVKTQT